MTDITVPWQLKVKPEMIATKNGKTFANMR